MADTLVSNVDRRNFLKHFAVAAVSGGGGAFLGSNSTVVQPAAIYPHINVKDFGALGNADTRPGSGHDDGPAFQAALDTAGNMGGGIVVVPRGNYRIAGNLLVPANVTLEGVFAAPTAWSEYTGTTLLAYNGRGDPSGTPFITLEGPNSMLKGLTIFYPEQTIEIIPFPWTIRGGRNAGAHDNLTIQDVLLVNPYQAVDFGTYDCGRHLIRGLYGYPLKTGIVVDGCYDTGRIDNVHFWPFWQHDNPGFLSLVANTATALCLKRTDWQIVHNFFAYGYHVGVQLLNGAGNIGTNGQFSNLNLDATNVGIDIYAIAPHGVQISNLNATGSTLYGQNIRRAIWAHTSPDLIGPLSVQNASFWGNFVDEAVLWQQGAPLLITSSIFSGWRPGGAAIRITGGRATIQGNYFTDQIGTSISIAAEAQQVIVMGNQLLGNPVESEGLEHLRLIANNL